MRIVWCLNSCPFSYFLFYTTLQVLLKNSRQMTVSKIERGNDIHIGKVEREAYSEVHVNINACTICEKKPI